MIGLRQKDYIDVAKDLILNLKLMCFLEPAEMNDFFQKIKKEFKESDELITSYLDYFEKTWMNSSVYGIKYWNYSRALIEDGGEINVCKKMNFTNNAVESCNNIINSLLPLGI